MLIEEPQTTETQGIGEFKRLEGTLFLSRFTDEELRFKLASSLTLLSSRTEIPGLLLYYSTHGPSLHSLN